MKKAKKFYQSKTLMLALALTTLEPLLRVFPELRATLGDNYGIALSVLSVTIAVLRFTTDQAVVIREPK
jgi:hypothetical protein